MEDLGMRKARSVYRILTEALDKNGWKYKADDDRITLAYGVKTENDDEPVTFTVRVDAEHQIVLLKTQPLLSFPAERLVEGAKAVCAANNVLVDGNFDLKLKGGALTYRQALVFRETTLLSVEALRFLLNYSIFAINTMLDKFALVSEGKLDGAGFCEACKSIE
ncbi:MAG: YbjN domain-containing protein [Clostridiales bacterium]|nr:YbjN domain-containing protein [Clostridiales bacterium]